VRVNEAGRRALAERAKVVRLRHDQAGGTADRMSAIAASTDQLATLTGVPRGAALTSPLIEKERRKAK
jgi:hypothetical protein